MKKIALVTGASSGIGFETALKLCEDYGYTVIAVSRNAEKLAGLERIAPAGRMIVIAADICTSVDEVVSDLHSHRITHIDILINNAGVLINKKFESVTKADLHKSYEVNLFAPYLLIQAMLPLLRKAPSAHIVNISSMGGFQGAAKFAGLSAYSSSKAALACLTECLAVELAGSEIRCNCLCLGAVQTEMLNEAFPQYKAGISAPEMAEFIANFAQQAHRYMNGKVIPVALTTP